MNVASGNAGRKVLVSVVMVALLLVACTTGLGAAGEKKTTIRFMHLWWREGELKVIDDLLAEFKAANPDIQVEVTRSSWADAYRELTTALAAGAMPDVMHVGSTWHVELMRVGALEPLNDYVTQEQLSDIFKSAWDFWSVGGKIAGIPIVVDPWGMVYRKDIFKEVGLDPEKPPATWNDLIEAGSKLKKLPDRWGVATYATAAKLQWNWVPVMYTAGCPLLTEEGGKWKSVISSPDGLRGMHAFVDLVRVQKLMPEGVVGEGFTEAIEGFKNGKYPILVPIGTFITAEMAAWDPTLTKWGVAEVPVIKQRATITSNHAYAMSRTCKNKKEAWRLMEFLTNAKNMPLTNLGGGTVPARKSGGAHPAYKVPYMQGKFKAAEFAQGHPKCAAFPEIMERAYAPTIQAAMLGRLSVEAAAKEMDEQASAILAKYGLAQ